MHVYNLALSLAVASATISSSNASDKASSAGVVQLDMADDAPVLDVLRTNAARKLGKSGKSSKSSKSNKSSKSSKSTKSTKGSKGGDSSSSKSKKSKKKSKKKNRANNTGNTAKREPVIINKADNSETDGGGVILNRAAASPSPTEAPSKTPTVPPSASPTENPTASPTSSPTETDVAADYQPFEQADWSMVDPGLDSGKSKNPVGVDSYTFTTFAPTFKPTSTPTVPPSESPVASPKIDLNANTYQCFYEQGVKICFTYNDDETCEMSVENKECSCCLYTNINHPVISSFDCTNLGSEWGGMGPCLAADTRAAELHFPSKDSI